MKTLQQCKHLVLTLLLLAPCGMAWAGWDLDSTTSRVNFVSVKNNAVGELHSFTSLIGFITNSGKAEVTIDLGSVETSIDLRNQRMREQLFEITTFPTAKVSAQLDPAVLAVATDGGVLTADLPVTLSLHGHDKALTIPVVVIGESGKHLRVFSAKPVLINAADFGLDAGVQALQKVAGLQAISTSVPVTLQLSFAPAK
jgi:polyisoprenoid-binding protein YceI